MSRRDIREQVVIIIITIVGIFGAAILYVELIGVHPRCF